MKETPTGKWAYSDENIFVSDEYDTKEEAKAAGIEEFEESPFDVGEIIALEFDEDDIPITVAEKIVESLYDALDEYAGAEARDQWDVTDEDFDDLNHKVASLVIEWVNEHELQPLCSKVGNIEHINRK